MRSASEHGRWRRIIAAAAMILSTLQGALLLSRASMSPAPYDAAVKQISRFLGF